MASVLREHSIQYLISLPPAASSSKDEIKALAGWFVANDPPGSALGSGGGTAHILSQAWRATGQGHSFRDWLRVSRKLIVHGGGQSRRLPAYSAIGKPLVPIPVIRNSFGQSVDQTWLDVQVPYFERVLSAAPEAARVMVTSGDVLLRFADHLPPMPEVDVLAMGMPVQPEEAEHFGVFFRSKSEPDSLSYFLQKPPAAEIHERSSTHNYLVDTGMWLLGVDGIMAMMAQCGWDEVDQDFAGGTPAHYELYAQFGLSLGTNPIVHHQQISALSSAVAELPSAEFYHLGASRQIIETFTVLQNQRNGSLPAWIRHPDQFILNSITPMPANRDANHTLWIENSMIPASWKLDCEHVLTGVPENDWSLNLERGVCLDFVPVGDEDYCVRAYGIDDRFSGAISSESTTWFGRPAARWLADRGLDWAAAGIDPETDIQNAPIFPVLAPASMDSEFVEWCFSSSPASNPQWSDLWLHSRRLSADDLRTHANVRRLLAYRTQNQNRALNAIYYRGSGSIFYRLDLAATARLWADSGLPLPAQSASHPSHERLSRVHDYMFRSAVLRCRDDGEWRSEEAAAFGELREAILGEVGLTPVAPVCSVLEDQIVWGRSPARLDLAGGWSDTPPYCLEHGGKVVNIAVNINGQPPVQVFGLRSGRPEIVIRSIDLGVEKRIATYEDLESYTQPGSEFALAKAALAVAGFLPRFYSGKAYSSLEEQLRAFGGGIQLSLLAAMPQGSGLGTSSILAATLLGTLGELCGLNWDKHEIISRTMAVEQMLTTGGGWQDQAGAVFGGLKLLETTPGLHQKPVVRWLPEHLFGPGYANERVLLYYTGLTRLAKNILQEIVRGVFLNSRQTLSVVQQIHNHADHAFDAIQCNDYERLCDAVRTSWELNQRLDSGTNPPEVQDILSRVSADLAAAKLLGAGGGGYLVMFARDAAAGARIRHTLEADPPNPRARFVDISVSQTGLEVSRS